MRRFGPLVPYRLRNFSIIAIGGCLDLMGKVHNILVAASTILKYATFPSMLLIIVVSDGVAPLCTTSSKLDGPLKNPRSM